jgi:phosphoribosylformylglycinamidine synthase
MLIEVGKVNAVHDVSDGGIGVAIAEMALAGNIGGMVAFVDGQVPMHAWLFGEDQARYVVTCKPGDAAQIEFHLNGIGLKTQFVGVVSGTALTLPGEAPISLDELRSAHEGWFPAFMGAEAAE